MTTCSQLIADPLYQINLCLWMLQPSTGVVVKSILRDSGYTLVDIEPPIPLLSELADSLCERGISLSDPVRPELLIVSGDREFVLVECKKSMFGSEPQPGMGDSQWKQARSLLLQAPKVLATALALTDVHETHVLYLACHDASVDQTEGLRAISGALQEQGYEVADFGLIGLVADDRRVMLRSGYAAGQMPKNLTSLGEDLIVVHEPDDTDGDPRPLYLLPWMPGLGLDGESYVQEAFGNRLLAAAAATLALATPPVEVDLNLDALLDLATLGTFSRWRDKSAKSNLRRDCRSLVRKATTGAMPKVQMRDLPGAASALSITLETAEMREGIVESFRKWEPEAWTKPDELQLFDDDVGRGPTGSSDQ